MLALSVKEPPRRVRVVCLGVIVSGFSICVKQMGGLDRKPMVSISKMLLLCKGTNYLSELFIEGSDDPEVDGPQPSSADRLLVQNPACQRYANIMIAIHSLIRRCRTHEPRFESAHRYK